MMKRKYWGLIGLAFAANAGATDSPATVQWALYYFPPVSIVVDGAPTTGFIDIKLKLLMERWPQAKHEMATFNTARAFRALDEGQELCIPATIITPERQKRWYLSPLALLPPQAIVARKEVASRIPVNKQGEVDAAALFNRTDLRGAFDEARSYSGFLDAVIAKRAPDAGLVHYRPSVEIRSHLSMLSLGRADYTIEYEFVHAYSASNDPAIAAAQFEVLNIEGMQPVPVGVACPRTAWGYAAIKKIDAILKSLAGNPVFENAELQWLTPQSRQRYRAQRAEFYRKRAKPTAFIAPAQ